VTSDLARSKPLTSVFSSPFVQRVWVALEAKGLQYQYIEVDPYKKPQALLDVNPRGLVPGLRHGDWGCGESTVLMEYVCSSGLQQIDHLLITMIA
jgi:glutathione S-transferase